MARVDLSTASTGAWTDMEAKTLFVERIFKAPRERVFKAFTESEQIEKWWGPREWPTTNKQMEVKPGGIWHYHMTGPDGTESWAKAIYREIVPPEKLVYLNIFSDADGNDNESMPKMVITFEFVDLGDNTTKLSGTAEYASAEDLAMVTQMGMVEGLSESLDKLEELLAA